MSEESQESPSEKPKPEEQPFRHHGGGRALALVAVAVVVVYALMATGSFESGPGLRDFFATRKVVSPEAEKPLPEVDWANIFAHTRGERAYAEQVAGEALAAYDRANAFGSGGLAEGSVAVKLFAVFAAAGDFYGEGVLQAAYFYAQAAQKKGSRDAMVAAICDVFPYAGRRPADVLDDFTRRLENVAALGKTDYPAVAKFTAATAELNVVTHGDAAVAGAVADDARALGDVAVAELKAVAASATPARFLITKASALMDAVGNSGEELSRVGGEVSQILADARVPAAELAVFRASLLMAQARAARGATPESGDLIAQRMQEAGDTLRKAAEEFPNDPWIPTLLMQVALVEGKGKAEMELWFNKAVQIDPKLRKPYANMMSNLQPAWYGSQNEVLAFGRRCVETGYWDEKIPLVQVDGIVMLANGAAPVYDSEEMWVMLRDTTLEFLKRFPGCISYRTLLLRYAVRAQRWETAKEQFAILGNAWDRQAMSDAQYERLSKQVGEH